jgi:hypothetical protein
MKTMKAGVTDSSLYEILIIVICILFGLWVPWLFRREIYYRLSPESHAKLRRLRRTFPGAEVAPECEDERNQQQGGPNNNLAAAALNADHPDEDSGAERPRSEVVPIPDVHLHLRIDATDSLRDSGSDNSVGTNDSSDLSSYPSPFSSRRSSIAAIEEEATGVAAAAVAAMAEDEEEVDKVGSTGACTQADARSASKVQRDKQSCTTLVS